MAKLACQKAYIEKKVSTKEDELKAIQTISDQYKNLERDEYFEALRVLFLIEHNMYMAFGVDDDQNMNNYSVYKYDDSIFQMPQASGNNQQQRLTKINK